MQAGIRGFTQPRGRLRNRRTGEAVRAKRYLLVVADDYGIGPATSQGILELARRREITGAVLLVNSPYAEVAVHAWRQGGQPMELGWHPCLTLDRPVLPPAQVPTLVRPDGTFWPLGSFLRWLTCGRVKAADVESELRAQLQRFEELVGHPPRVINAHHHLQVFPPIGAILITLLPHGDPCDWDSYSWAEAPPADCIERRLGRPHLTWIFVSPTDRGFGTGTALLAASVHALLALGFTQLLSTFMAGNDQSILWHWRNGFQLLAHPGSVRLMRKRWQRAVIGW